ncbi:MAG: glycerol-3-phosphate acyltransferase [Pelatocladus maniniholoensis HA4357-MV3]|jgi:phosphoenolpyruvate synthase/pyruvate phosphate dikinase/glycerol-3-phosphate acyltransferase PlsY|uniref:Glycerol-3-phosphate acyltransferase n=1 Tax=Pelatocladus maniniholoensis HA4357-MV3 TaxID=1117104 RepID=A0A9E3LT86_9NOST|nr:glycerol-3-phosphate acyltransferase [Pelatocladus maniniholoensis HA4357-MV3]
MLELWGVLVIVIICPLLGALPLIAWITQALTGQQLAEVGTGNIGVSAAFYHGGTLVGILAVLSEAAKGIIAVLIARAYFPNGSAWELVALIALVMGRYLMGRGAGTTNVVWGFMVHDPLAAGFILLVTGVSFTILRDRQLAKNVVVITVPIIVAILHMEDPFMIIAAIGLAALLGWIYKQIPDDLDLPVQNAKPNSQAVLQFLRGDQGILSLDDELDPAIVGNKAAKLSQMKRWGYPVPKGWVLMPYEDPQQLIDFLQPSELSPLVVRSSAIDEDSEQASGAGQYETVLNVTTREGLENAIAKVQVSYNEPLAVQYRRDRNVTDTAIAVLVQLQVQSVFSGVAFSRDPMTQEQDAVVIEALPGSAVQVVSGRVTPEQYRAFVVDTDNLALIQLEGQGRVPAALIKQVAYLARRLEDRYYGVPQDIEWSYDGQTLWVLQTRPISTLLPIWTRKIAAEVIPGLIRPLTWSINRPLTCGVWGGIFALVLGKKAVGLNFNETATLHYSHAYFNATLLGQIFRRMGLPPESLEFLTRGEKLSKPPLNSTLENLPGLLRLLMRELWLGREFRRDYRQHFAPGLSRLSSEPLEQLDSPELLARINYILDLLHRATFYSIMAPLSAAIRQAIFKVKDSKLDNSLTPEVAALRSLQNLAAKAKQQFSRFKPDTVFANMAESESGQEILDEFDQLLQRYGYMSEVGTDIAIPTWKEEPQVVKQLLVQFMQGNEPPRSPEHQGKRNKGFVQSRMDLKGRVTEIYSQLLAHLRWSFVALEQIWLNSSLLSEAGDIFFLEFAEIKRLIEGMDTDLVEQLSEIVKLRRSQLVEHGQINPVSLLVYGNTPPALPLRIAPLSPDQVLQGIPASPGQAVGRVKVLRNLQSMTEIDKETILVVPYTDSGWAPLLVRAGGLISEAGGRLSHGAILAREYGIPAIMDVHNATWIFQDGQQVRIDGTRGIVEISNDIRPE